MYELTESPTSRLERRVLIILVMVTMIAPLSLDLYLTGLPELRDDLGASRAAAQLTVTTCIVGFALGQLVSGVVSDARGRRAPLLIGLFGWILATVLCALAPSIGAVIALRLVQGFGAGVGMAVSRAVISDLDPGNMIRHISRMMLIVTVIPVLGPALGGLLLPSIGWRGLFIVLAALGAVPAAAVLWLLPESLPHRVRISLSLGPVWTSYRTLLSDRAFVLPTLASGAAFGVMFAYIGSSAFLFRETFGLGATAYGFLFGINAAGLILGMQFSSRLVDRLGTGKVQLTAAATGLVGAALLLVLSLLPTGLAGVLIPLFVVIVATGVLIPVSSGAAIGARAQGSAGNASGLMGSLQFTVGGLIGALATLTGAGQSAFPLAVAILFCHMIALVLTVATGRK